MARVLLVHWNDAEAEQRLAQLRRLGHEAALLKRGGMPPLRALARRPPDLILIDLSRLPSQGGAVAIALRQRKATRSVPLVFLGGEPEKVARQRALLPDAAYAEWRGIRTALRAAAKPRAEKPLVPGTMAGYSGTPLPRKLGLAPGRSLALLGAPPDFEETLGALPEGGALVPRGPADVSVLFARSVAELRGGFAAGVRRMGERGRLWIAWPKQASGLASDLTQQGVREFGLARGLVDFKVCAIDATWSGLCFVRRRA